MRHLVLMRGAAGCGKSTAIKKLGLEQFTLSPDNLRMMFQNPVPNLDGTSTITGNNESKIWKMLFELLEQRMQRGDFTVIDATHSTTSMITQYKELCTRYRYRCTVIDMSDVPVETILEQNSKRPPHKFVPEDRIAMMVERLEGQKPPRWVNVVTPETFEEETYYKARPYDDYKKIHVIGDVHGCYDALMEYLDGGFKDDELYIFVGDYVDRGPQNHEVMKFLLATYRQSNVILLEGNHERHLWNWANDFHIRSSVFVKETQPQLEYAGISKKEVRMFYRALRQAFSFTYGENEFIVTHGGIATLDGVLEHVATKYLIGGVGNYSDDIDEVWTKNTKENQIQIHGHRNLYRLPVEASPRSYNLEGQVESGNCLRAVTITAEGIQTHEVKNEFYISRKDADNVMIDEDKLTSEALIDYLKNHKNIREKEITENISSFNFDRDAFESKKWDDITVKARGLFMNLKTKEIIARSYNKFFNIEENSSTRIVALAEKVVFPLYGYEKPNGYLGIIGYDSESDTMTFHSKSEMRGPYAERFKKIFMQAFEGREEIVEEIKQYIKDNNESLTFEVIDVECDPHIIEYQQNHVVLLDAVKRDIVYSKLPYESIQELGNRWGIQTKQRLYNFENWVDFYMWYREAKDDFSIEDEGVVFEDSEGYMFKFKRPFYKFWKHMRSIKHLLSRKNFINTGWLSSKEHNEFYNWAKHKSTEELRSKSIIELRNEFMSERG